MLAHADGENINNPNYVAEEKYDGTRAVFFKVGNKIRFWGRSWKKEYTDKYPELVKEGKKLRAKQCILDCELTFWDGKADFFLSALAKRETWQGKYRLSLMVFDIIEFNNKDVTKLPMEERKRLLKKVVPSSLKYIKLSPVVKENKQQFFKELTSDPRQGEGIMLKRKGSIYQEGVRSYDWLKMKAFKDTDCAIVGYTPGRGAREQYFGALILGQYVDGVLRYVGKAGTGLDNEMIRKLDGMLRKIETANSPLLLAIDREHVMRYHPGAKWVRLKYVAEIKYESRSAKLRLRWPVFVRLRRDKRIREAVI